MRTVMQWYAVYEECGNKYLIPCIAQGGPGSVYPGVYKSLCDSIDRLNEKNLASRHLNPQDFHGRLCSDFRYLPMGVKRNTNICLTI